MVQQMVQMVKVLLELIARNGSHTSPSGAGGSGVVILRMSTADYNQKTGITGTYSASAIGTDTAITWTASGNITF